MIDVMDVLAIFTWTFAVIIPIWSLFQDKKNDDNSIEKKFIEGKKLINSQGRN